MLISYRMMSSQASGLYKAWWEDDVARLAEEIKIFLKELQRNHFVSYFIGERVL